MLVRYALINANLAEVFLTQESTSKFHDNLNIDLSFSSDLRLDFAPLISGFRI